MMKNSDTFAAVVPAKAGTQYAQVVPGYRLARHSASQTRVNALMALGRDDDSRKIAP